MSEPSPGWYPDPDPSAPPASRLRWWDGGTWTQHLAPVPGAGSHAGRPALDRDRTPDGARIPSWGRRLVAYLVDAVLTGVLVVLIALPWTRQVLDAYGGYVQDAFEAAERGGRTPSTSALLESVAGPLLAIGIVGLLVGLVYHVGFLRLAGATPGKALMGLTVRLRERPGRLPWSAALLHWLVQYGLRGLGLLPVVGPVLRLVVNVFVLLDGLWPLWDRRKQALHDRAARTNVVHRRR